MRITVVGALLITGIVVLALLVIRKFSSGLDPEHGNGRAV